jgi:hypothetical protein
MQWVSAQELHADIVYMQLESAIASFDLQMDARPLKLQPLLFMRN